MKFIKLFSCRFVYETGSCVALYCTASLSLLIMNVIPRYRDSDGTFVQIFCKPRARSEWAKFPLKKEPVMGGKRMYDCSL